LKSRKEDGKILQVIMQSRILRVASREQNKTVFTEINHVSFLSFFFSSNCQCQAGITD